jgi:hypothetical protein
MISNVLPFFVEIKKIRIKKNIVDNLLKQTVIINKNLSYNLKLKRFSDQFYLLNKVNNFIL